MFTSADKALVAFIMAVAYFVNNFTSFHFALDQDTVSLIVSAMTPFVVWLAPNKGA